MNLWEAAATVLIFGLLPCGVLLFRNRIEDRLVGLEMAGVVEVMLLMLLAQALGNSVYFDLALALAFMMFGGNLVFARFLESWM